MEEIFCLKIISNIPYQMYMLRLNTEFGCWTEKSVHNMQYKNLFTLYAFWIDFFHNDLNNQMHRTHSERM